MAKIPRPERVCVRGTGRSDECVSAWASVGATGDGPRQTWLPGNPLEDPPFSHLTSPSLTDSANGGAATVLISPSLTAEVSKPRQLRRGGGRPDIASNFLTYSLKCASINPQPNIDRPADPQRGRYVCSSDHSLSLPETSGQVCQIHSLVTSERSIPHIPTLTETTPCLIAQHTLSHYTWTQEALPTVALQ